MRRRHAVLALILTVTAAGAAPEAPPDLVLLHGKIHTQDPSRRVVAALAVRGHSIVAVGTDQAIAALAGPGTRTVDLAGRVVLPGIIDAHVHPAGSAQDIGKCSLGDRLMTPAKVKAEVTACLKANPGDPAMWFEVVNVNPSELTLTLAELDAILPDRPLLMTGSDGHTTWSNSRTLAAAQLTAATQSPTGGRIEHDANGNPTGTLRDTASSLVRAVRPAPSMAFQVAQLEMAFVEMRAVGITSVQDASVDEHLMQVYKALYDAHRLDMRVRASFTLRNAHEPAAATVAKAVAFRTKWAIDPDFLRADAVKLFADGVIEYPSHTAAMLEPYLDASGHPTTDRGPTYFSQEEMNGIVSGADAAGFTVHIHAIGDRAVRSALDAYAEARRRNGATDNRHQIAHLELIDPADFGRFRQLGVIANFQLLWAEDEDYVARATVPYLGPVRSRYLYPARSIRDAGGMIAGGSDWGVSSVNPFAAMEHAITRAEGRGQRPLLPEQSITLQDAVDAYTIHAAHALKQERTTGSLEKGKRADFVILDRDIFTIDPFDLHDTKAVSTYLDGREVFAGKTR